MKTKIVSIALTAALVAQVFGLGSTAFAGGLHHIKDTLSNSQPTKTSNHTFDITTQIAITAGTGNEINITMPAGFTLTGITSADITMTLNGVAQPVTAGATPTATNVGYLASGQLMRFVFGSSVALGANQIAHIVVGGTNKITNPVAGSYRITFSTLKAGVATDYGTASIVINDSFEVSLDVESYLTFTVGSVASGAPCPNSGGNATVTSTATKITFGSATVGTPSRACHNLSVSTNADQGYNVTVEQATPMTSGSGETIKKFAGASGSANTWTTPEAWTAPAGTNHSYFGFTTNDSDVRSGAFNTNLFGSFQTDATPYTIMAGTAPTNTDSNYVTYQAQIDALQKSGRYIATLMYIATGTF